MKICSFGRSLSACVVGCITLAALVSDTYAGTWSNPVYTITNRQPSTDPNTTTPAGGGGSVTNQGLIDSGGPAASGTVEAKFTWTPAQGQTMASDPPPENLLVVETANAGWGVTQETVFNPRGRGGGVAPNSQAAPIEKSGPSASLSVFQKPQKPRSLLIQLQGGGGGANGTANNGLGSPYVAGTDGRSGRSSGSRVDAHSVDNGEVKVTASLSASCAANNPNTTWTYSAQIVSVSLQHSNSWSPENPYPDAAANDPDVNQVPPYGVPFELPRVLDENGIVINEPKLVTFSELRADLSPAGVGAYITGNPWNIKNSYDVVVEAFNRDGTFAESEQLVTNEQDPDFPDSNIAIANGGDTIFVMDIPGLAATGIQSLLNSRPQNPLGSVTVIHYFTTQLTYQGKKVGPIIHWQTIITATRNANGTVSYSNTRL